MALTKSKYANQGSLPQPLSDSDGFVVSQNTGNYTTGTSYIGLLKNQILTTAQGNTTNRIANIANSPYLTGNGTPANPTQLNLNQMSRLWVPVQAGVGLVQVGDLSSTTLPFTITNTMLTQTANLTVFIGGQQYTLAATTYSLSGYTSGLNVNVYLSLNNNTVGLIMQAGTLSESASLIWIGGIQTGAGAGAGWVPFVRLGLTRFSETPQGGSVPISQGDPSMVNYPTWGGTGSDTPPVYGVDTTQSSGNITFNRAYSNFTINNSGQFYIRNLALMLQTMPDCFCMRRYGTVAGGTGYLNGQQIWSDIGTCLDTLDISRYLVEGWNTVTFTNGGCSLRIPFIN